VGTSWVWVVVYWFLGIFNLLCPTMINIIIVVNVARVRLTGDSLWLHSVRELVTTINMLEGGATADRPVPDTIIRCVSRHSVHGFCAASML
jgi:hypothetical protein